MDSNQLPKKLFASLLFVVFILVVLVLPLWIVQRQRNLQQPTPQLFPVTGPELFSTIFFGDDFNRADGATVGNGWVEREMNGAAAGLQAGRMCFLDTSDRTNRPLVRHTFQKVTSGQLAWGFDFDWKRSGDETTYRLFLQLGEGAQMSDTSQDAGVGVNLVWTAIGEQHEQLAYRQGGEATGITTLSGGNVLVTADLSEHTYSVRVNGSLVKAGIPFDKDVPLDTVRFFTDALNETSFSNRCFDNLFIGLPAPEPTTATVTATSQATPTFTAPSPATPSVNTGEYVEITLLGPESTGMGDPNPFKIQVDVSFTGPDGQSYRVPGFYDGNGSGGMDGRVWKARFSPDQPGAWQFTSISSEPLLDNQTGSFNYAAPSACQPYSPGGLPDFACVGVLKYAGGHYLKFANGPYWVKGGEDDPEDFLAPGVSTGFDTKNEAVDYLASKGVNSLYMLLQNIDGDGNNVWPWVGATAAEAKSNSERFDLARMAEWEAIFTHLQDRGLVLHLVFEDDSGWTGFNRSMYYREMIARFGHHRGTIWNISEEYQENYSPDQVKSFAQMIRDLDPYDHPITVHHANNPDGPWQPFLGDERFDLTSFQTSDPASPQNPLAVSWFQKVEDSGRTIPVSFDETGKIGADSRDLGRQIAWSVYMGGANFEMHTWPFSNFQDFGGHFEDMTRARAFLEELPFWEMRPMNELLTSGQGYVFGKPGEIYAIYLPEGGPALLDLTSDINVFAASWFNPRDGSFQNPTSLTGGSVQTVDSPSGEDWALIIKMEPAGLPTPTATPSYTAEVTPTGIPTGTSSATSTPSPTTSSLPTATATATAGPAPLFSDSFNRANSGTVGNGWVEREMNGAAAGLQAGRMCFLDTSDRTNRPLVRHTFQKVTSGQLAWGFDFDWKRSGDETTYRLFLQLGEGAQMSDTSQDAGVGVNLVWTAIGEQHEQLAYRQGGAITAITTLTGPNTILVTADLSEHTYSVRVNGSLVKAGIPFEKDVPLDTVRFFTDALNETNFSNRCFDNLILQSIAP